LLIIYKTFMSRVKIDLPANELAVIQIAVRITDVNYGNHVGNDAVVGILHEARVQWLRQNGFTELDVGGAGIIMSDLEVAYLREIFYGDQLTITLGIADLGKTSFDLFYGLENQSGETVAKTKTGIVCFDYALKKVVAIPAGFFSILIAQ